MSMTRNQRAFGCACLVFFFASVVVPNARFFAVRLWTKGRTHAESTRHGSRTAFDFEYREVGKPRGMVSACNGQHWMRETPKLSSFDFEVISTIWQENARLVLFCPDLLGQISTRSTVPRIIHRIWECAQIPSNYFEALLTWEDNAPYTYTLLWSNELREEFISRQLGEEKLAIYRRLLPGAFRADFFKYFIMHYVGGIYSDLDTFLNVNILQVSDFLSGPTMAIDLEPTRLLPGALLMSPAGNPLFVCAMGETLDHASKREYPGSGLDVSGPGVLGECMRHILGVDGDFRFKAGNIGLGHLMFRLLESFISSQDRTHVVKISEGSEIIRLMSGGTEYNRTGMTPSCDPGEHYSTLYNKRQIYAM